VKCGTSFIHVDEHSFNADNNINGNETVLARNIKMYAWPGAFVLALLLGTGVALNSRDRQALSEAFEVLCPESSVCANDGNMTLGDIQTSCCTCKLIIVS